jgi:transposase
VETRVVDSASLAVNRRQRRAKADRLDVHQWLTMVLRHVAGERKVWSVGRVPSIADEDRRPLHRERLTTQRARRRVRHRMKGLLAGCGVRLARQGEVEAQLEQARQWDGSALSAAVRARLHREGPQGCFRTPQIDALGAARRAVLRTRAEPVVEQVRPLATLRGMGVNRAWLLVRECLAWRDLKTSHQGGAFAGLTPTPDQSGRAARDRGITKAGNGEMRTRAVAMAWGGGRFQPESPLTPWDQARFGRGSARLRHIGMVGLARKLRRARWRCLNTRGLPAGAILKAQVAVEEVSRGGCGALALVWAARCGAWALARTEDEAGRPTPGLPRRRERREEKGCGVGMPTRRAGRGGR